VSDYVGALLRSAGIVPAPGGHVGVTPTNAHDDLVEHVTERNAGPGTAPFAGTPAFAAHGRKADPVQVKAVGRPAPASSPGQVKPAAPSMAPAATAQMTPPRLHETHAPPPPATTPLVPATSAEPALHPMVEAALRWVAAEPGPAPIRPGADVRSDLHLALAHASTTVLRGATAPGPAPLPRVRAEPFTAVAREPAARAAPAPGMARSAPASQPGSARAAQDTRPEIHIGAIHLTVDAPRPAAPPPAPARGPQMAPAAPRSAFLRSRAPRI